MSMSLQLARSLSLNNNADGTDRTGGALVPENNVIVISPRNHKPRICAALQAVSTHKLEAARGQVIESVSLMLAQFHGALADAATAGMKKLFEEAAELHDRLDEFSSLDMNGKMFKTACDALASLLKPFFALSSSSRTLTIAQCREIQGWCRLTALDRRPRIIIIEALEQATEGARNSLLKLLEEPPENSRFILVTSHPERMMATILSRVRQYRFASLSPKVAKEIIISRYGCEVDKNQELKDFILTAGGEDDAKKISLVQEAAHAFAIMMSETETEDSVNLSSIITTVEDSDVIPYFFERMAEELRTLHRQDSLPAPFLHSCLAAVSQGYQQYIVYNLPLRSLLESLCFDRRRTHE
ncbi:hypothetical protein [Parasphaerochaeta coccoides]|nr:hypothetical protein [Parasphaerochaeta coccoides]